MSVRQREKKVPTICICTSIENPQFSTTPFPFFHFLSAVSLLAEAVRLIPVLFALCRLWVSWLMLLLQDVDDEIVK